MHNTDPEIEAMGKIASALSTLDEPTCTRVLRWAYDKYSNQDTLGAAKDPEMTPEDQETTDRSVRTYTEFAEIFNDYDPKDDDEKVLIAAYWVQVIEGNEKWSSVPVNKHLRNTGHAISYINRVLKRCSERKPAPVLILAKSGKNQQARKTHKLTVSGITDIEKRLKNSAQ